MAKVKAKFMKMYVGVDVELHPILGTQNYWVFRPCPSSSILKN
jgi:hypothetical protein